MSQHYKTELIRIDPGDGVFLDGVLWTPEAGGSELAIVLFPGTGAEFYNSLFSYLGAGFASAGYMTLAINRRDHGARFGFHTLAAGSADQGPAIDFLSQRGARRIVAGGHSYGTITVPWYISETDDDRVNAILLYAPLGDLRPASVEICGGRERYERFVTESRQMVAAGRGAEAFLIPPMVPGAMPFLHTYEVFLDKRGPDSRAVPTDLLPKMGNRKILGIRDPADPYPATLPPAQEMLEASNPNLHYVLLDDVNNGLTTPDAHYYRGREEEVLQISLRWLEKNGLST
ncbi:MAG: alpha/beta hydrolase [Pseudomonadota bacterium]|nr:alpha/beta hydrolase [Pseudomonadota bacterium]